MCVCVHTIGVINGDKQNFNEIFKRQLNSSGGEWVEEIPVYYWECDSRSYSPTCLSSWFLWFDAVLGRMAEMADFPFFYIIEAWVFSEHMAVQKKDYISQISLQLVMGV